MGVPLAEPAPVAAGPALLADDEAALLKAADEAELLAVVEPLLQAASKIAGSATPTATAVRRRLLSRAMEPPNRRSERTFALRRGLSARI